MQKDSRLYWGVFYGTGCKVGRIVPVPLIESAKEYRSIDELDSHLWVSHSFMCGGIADLLVGRKEIGYRYMVYYVLPDSADERKNHALHKVGVHWKGDVLIMRAIWDYECSQYQLESIRQEDLTFVTDCLARRQIGTNMADASIARSLDSIIRSYYNTPGTSISKILYQTDIYGEKESSNTWRYFDRETRKPFRATLLVSSGISGQLLFDAQVNMLQGLFYKDQEEEVNTPSAWNDDGSSSGGSAATMRTINILDEAADFPVKIEVSFAKHVSLVGKDAIEEGRLSLYSSLMSENSNL
ncbi:uncharacterized protein EV420DRAFT_1478269 [Desarmillaria tabescens]|uniref:Uncharacterized protein n=1 Tax=Armillaria tabescens TaxID=1929756 RepID=A0AA39N7J7_ARMTA|nr:uncharacterized protein EV420DRAFT_1478269 [Desarmillaria tabescens]KAK0460491.1 hypothetical protein EV420DRAFT_1478269 [Desarmillaria tabescens]